MLVTLTKSTLLASGPTPLDVGIIDIVDMLRWCDFCLRSCLTVASEEMLVREPPSAGSLLITCNRIHQSYQSETLLLLPLMIIALVADGP